MAIVILFLEVIAVLSVGAEGASCDECWATYDAATKTCTVAYAFITCMEDAVNPGCPTSGLNMASFIGQIGGCSQTALCTCQKDHLLRWSQGTPSLCESEKQKLGCIGGVTDAACDTTTKGHTVATSTETDINAIGGCAAAFTDTCQCEKTYALADISVTATRCTVKKTFVDCLKGKTGPTCRESETVISLATTVGSTIGTDCTGFTSSACSCELEYAKADISSEANRCTAQLNLVSCLKGKTGAGCIGGTTHSLATTAFDTTIPAIGSCALTDTCTCEANYAKADISSDANHCTALGTFVSCLKTKTDPGCMGTSVTALGLSTETAYGSLTSQCAITTKTCGCEVAYVKMPYSSDGEKCTAEMTLVSCLKGKEPADMSCDGASTSIALATAAGGRFGTITSCSPTDTCTACELGYAKATINDPTNKCSALAAYIGCLRTKTAAGCVSTDTVPTLATTAETDFKATSCTVTPRCQCEIDYAKATRTSDADKCTALVAALLCLKGKTTTGCNVATVDGLDVQWKKDMDTIGTTNCAQSDTCVCEVAYAKSDLSDLQKKCDAWLVELGCLRTTTAVGCDGSSTKAEIDTAIKTKMNAATPAGGATSDKCTTNPVCLCEIAYAVALKDTDANKCTALKTYVSCLAGETVSGCDGATKPWTLAAVAKASLDDIGTTNCPLTTTCLCEIDYASTVIDDDTKKCSALKTNLDCVIKSSTASCDGTARHTYAGSIKSAMDGTIGCPATYASAGICKDCVIPFAPAATTCTTLGTYYQCLYDTTDTTGCGGSKTIKTLVEDQATHETDLTCTLEDVCQCQVNFMKSSSVLCDSLKVVMNCLWACSSTACDGTAKRHSVATTANAKIDPTCTGSLSEVCKCQIAYTIVDPTTDHCGELKKQFACLEGKTGTGCETSRTLKLVAEGGNTKFGTDSCAAGATATCQCQIAYLIADVTGANKCTETEKKIACLYATTTASCDAAVPRTTIMSNTDNTCSKTSSCSCQRAYGIDTTSADECTAQKGVVTCLRSTTDTGCTGEAAFTKTRTQLGTDLETYLTSSCSSGLTDTCQCQIEYAKASMEPAVSLCMSLGELISCLAGKTALACDGSMIPSVLTTNVQTDQQTTCNKTSAPTDVHCSSSTDSSLQLQWTDRQQATVYYVVEIGRGGGTDWQQVNVSLTTTDNQQSAWIDNLQPQSVYFFRIHAKGTHFASEMVTINCLLSRTVGMSDGAIIAIVLAVVLAVLLLIAGIYVYRRRHSICKQDEIPREHLQMGTQPTPAEAAVNPVHQALADSDGSPGDNHYATVQTQGENDYEETSYAHVVHLNSPM
ncbi:uncharacterized protein LOC124127803 isoform X3 [Haliotis rufescens]|uniref:uncharacterized protein LOC124127803 isoform X3 n=1 Tax=Haliotis rufescens TaxID=6454 RepID=UPI00201EBFCC|nr:uncharacterized protein LOC124127803 isoform X3 [Haliotis rufescens]